jgi:hypothetical protein
MTLDLEPIGREIFHPFTGELLDLSSMTLEHLAHLSRDMQAYREQITEFEEALSDALLAHLDASAEWTQRVGSPTDEVQLEIKAPSPAAGTEGYLEDVLEGKLQTLVGAETITPSAASKACKRQLVLTLGVPWDANLQDLAETVKDPEAVIQIAGVRVDVVKADASVKYATAGINALRKVPGTAEALDAAKVDKPAPPRKARVTVKGRGA